MLTSDIRDRAIPWTILQLSYGGIINDLNVSRIQRISSAFTGLALVLGVLSFWNLWFLAGTAVLMIPVIIWNRRLYRLYYEFGGLWFCLRALVMHWLYYLYSGLSFGIGCILFLIRHPRPNNPGSKSRASAHGK